MGTVGLTHSTSANHIWQLIPTEYRRFHRLSLGSRTLRDARELVSGGDRFSAGDARCSDGGPKY
ncbi:hypothetical protein BH686_16760 [Rhodococcus erythropolis]|nr:hypothetical protein BH686_16760 [Rhodococcus erythropolis]